MDNGHFVCTQCSLPIEGTAMVFGGGYYHQDCLQQPVPDLEDRIRAILIDNLGTTTLTNDRFKKVVHALAEEFSK